MSTTGYERAQVTLKCPHLPNKPNDKFDEWRWTFLQFVEGIDPRFLICLADENGPLTLDELRAFVTPTANELKQSREGLGAGDPPTPLQEQKAALDALGADYEFNDLELCIPEKVRVQLQVRLRAFLADALQGHPALLTLRRAGNHPSEMWERLNEKYAHVGPISNHKLLVRPADNILITTV